MFSRSLVICLRIAVLSMVILELSSGAFAQVTSGSFRGQVTDPTGAAVPGAVVSARNQTTGVSQEVTTNEEGNFVLSHLVPGTYSVTASKQGFKALTRTDLLLDLDQQINLNLALTMGQITEAITVTSAAPVIQTHSVDTGQVIETREILDLPLADRNFLSLVYLTAGVIPGAGGNSNNFSVNGQREFGNSIVLNGIEVTSNRNNDAGVTPSVDAMEEFKVVTSAYAAEFGRAAGGVVILQTKPGSNNFHGDAYIFYRPKQTAASDYFSLDGSHLHHDNFGGTIGGPIRRDKTFFFVSYEGNRLGDSTSFLSSTPPTNQIKFLANGDADLSGLLDPATGNQVPIFDPNFYAQNFYSQQFPGNVIPADRVSAAGKAILLDFFPVPSLPGIANGWYNNSIYNSAYNFHGDNVDVRVDHNFSGKDRLAAEYHFNKFHSNQSDPYGNQIVATGGGGTDTGDNTHQQNQAFSIGETHFFSPLVINDFRFGFNNFALSQFSLLNGQSTADKYGVGNVNLAGFPATEGFPYIYLGTGYTTGGSSYKPLTFLDRNYQIVDTVSISRARHQFKFGGEYRNLSSRPFFSLFPTGYQYYAGAYSYANFTSDPTYGFYDTSAAFPTGGSDLADLLLGLPYTVNIGLQLTNPETKSWELHGFFQDEWQLSSHFSLFYGVRYEYQNPYYEANNNYSNYNPKTNTILLAGRGGNSSALVNADKNNFGPRVGFAYQFNNKTVIRGGYGVYYSPENDARSDVLTKNYPFNNQQLYFNDINAFYSSGFPTYQLDAGVPRDTTIHIPSGASSIDPSTITNSKAQSVYYVDPNFRTGYSQLYNLTVQREIVPNLSVDVAYVGSQGRKLPYAVGNINLNNGITPLLGHIQAQYSEGNSAYNSLQIKLTKRYSNNLSFLIAYTFGNSIDNGPAPFNLGANHQSPQNPFDLAAERGLSSNDIKHNVVGSVNYGLPFGHNRMFLSEKKGWQEWIIGGWQLNGITEIHTGLPYNIVVNGNNQNYPGLRPDIIGDPTLSNPTYGRNGQYFNPAAFAKPTCPVSNPNCPGDLGRDAFRGPGFFNIDASLFKDFPIREHLKFQFRFEVFNILNHPSFANPNADFTDKQTFGKVTGTASGPRELQFAAKLIF
jgi:hypothetical protein